MLGFNFIIASLLNCFKLTFMHIHALVKIILYLSTLILLSGLSGSWLVASCFISLLLAVYFEGARFTSRLVKLRWLLFSIVMVYAFSTPGEYLRLFDHMDLAMTKEGLSSGLAQALRLLTAIACLSILLVHCSIYQLVGGLKKLLAPLTYIGFNVNCFVVRLLLTLHYVDEVTSTTKKTMRFLNLHAMLEASNVSADFKVVEVEDLPLVKADYAVLVVICMVSIWLGLI
jgi:energy-coupling factor transport system permease protein